MSAPTEDVLRFAPPLRSDPPLFEPSTALAILDGLVDGGPAPETGSAWDAAWIACLTGSPRWIEAARREFIRAVEMAEASGA